MLKKIDWSRQFLENHLENFACPYCRSAFVDVDGYSLVCEQGHRFDISKKGTMHLLQQKANEDYDATLFDNRYALAQSGFFDPLLERVSSLIVTDDHHLVVDIGCGEGSPLATLSESLPQQPLVGMDIAKEGIQAASLHHAGTALWVVADLAQLPFANQSCITLINMLTPSNYREFDRVLTPNGRLIKIIPGDDYLIELRQQLYRSREDRQHYSNTETLERFRHEYPQMTAQEVRYTVALSTQDYHHLLQMTPLYWGATQEDRDYSHAHPLTHMTVHLWILIGDKSEQE